jgi:hypothetical protein
MGMDGHVINTVMEMGDEFLRRKNIDIALEFYREARFLFPYVAICCIREALCYVIQVSMDLPCRMHPKSRLKSIKNLPLPFKF